MAAMMDETAAPEVDLVLNGAHADMPRDFARPGERALDPAVVTQIAAFKTRLQASIGEVVLAMLNLPRYRNPDAR